TGRRVLRLEVPALVEEILEAHDLARREESDAVAELTLRRQIFAHRECRSAERARVRDADIEPGARADALREQVARCAAERARGADEHVALVSLEAGKRLAGDGVRERFGLLHRGLG